MATLKISELSVGDWVMCDEDKYRVMGVTMFHELDLLKSSESFRTSIDNIHPIPITAEILEKIGFGKKTFTQDQLLRIVESDGNMPFIGYRWDSRRVIIERSNDYMLRVKAEYIHQLQHALRLAGFDKEINL